MVIKSQASTATALISSCQRLVKQIKASRYIADLVTSLILPRIIIYIHYKLIKNKQLINLIPKQSEILYLLINLCFLLAI